MQDQEFSKLDIKPAQASYISRLGMTSIGRIFLRTKWLSRKFKIVGDLADYVSWLGNNFELPKGMCRSREHLWSLMNSQMSTDKNWTAFEFGVAWGYTTQFWLTRLNTQITKWHGYDRFTGLPRAWRDVDAGEFDAGGLVPAIADDRLCWHIGDVEDQLVQLDIDQAESSKVVFFDLDLYEPTSFAFRKLLNSLSPGDILYFDEAYDDDERRVINELVFKHLDCRVIGFTYIALALEIVRHKRD